MAWLSATARTLPVRKIRGDFDKYLHGNGIDIGSGTGTLVVDNGTVQPWDKKRGDGDAQFMAGVADEVYDFVYSSHCLEHLRDVAVGLSNWIRILKPGGFLYVVVPDYTLYEHDSWPSRYNPDHKFSFSLTKTKEDVGRSNHFHIYNDLIPLMSTLGVEFVFCALEDDGYDYRDKTSDQTRGGRALAQICVIGKKGSGYQVKE